MLFCSSTVAQQDTTVLRLDSLVTYLYDAINEQRSIEIDEIKGVYKITPWHFVPSLNYDFINNNYYVTISSGPFVTNMISKRQETRRISAATRKYDNQIKSAEIRLRSLIISVNHKFENLHLSHIIVTNDIEIFLIKFAEHSNHEIDTETFLKEKSGILNKIKSHNNDVADIQRQLLEIELLTETGINIDLSGFVIAYTKILEL